MLCVLGSSFFRKSVGALVAGLVLSLTGCALPTISSDAPVAAKAMQGKVYGGQQPVSGAHVYLMAATVSGVGNAGYGLAATSLLTAAQTGNSDSIGAYVLTGTNGTFTITGDYTCPSASTQIYLYVRYGTAGFGTNTSLGMMAALGNCYNVFNASPLGTYQVNELTTVAAAYALAGFMSDPQHISIPQYASAATQTSNTIDQLAINDLANAFQNANNLVNTTTGAAQTSIYSGNGTPNSAQVITLANILASCVNSSGAVTGPSSPTACYTLFNNAGSSGGSNGTIPSDTATAIVNIAHHPYTSSAVTGNLYGLATGTAPFTGGDSAQPADFTVGISFTGGGMNQNYCLAVDAAGNIWTASPFSQTLTELTPGGSINQFGGFNVNGMNGPYGMAVDTAGNVWIPEDINNSLSEFTSSGAAATGSPFSGGGLNNPYAAAIDGSGNIWVSNDGGTPSLSKFASNGTTSTGPFSGGGLALPQFNAVDASGNIWLANAGVSTVSKFSSTGTPSGTGYATGAGSAYGVAVDNSGNIWVGTTNGIAKLSGTTGAALTGSPFANNGTVSARSIAIDGAGTAWITNYNNNGVNAFSNSGTALSPSSGYTGAATNGPYAIAVDGSGNIWVTNGNAGSSAGVLTEIVGAGTPVVTPLAASLAAPYSAAAAKP